MRLFKRYSEPRINAIKLYCIGEPVNREALLFRILTSLQTTFGTLPDEYDIGGPYGVKKGSTIGYQSFQNKLTRKGHEKYYALSGETGGQFGFRLLLGAHIDGLVYSELILWYASGTYTVNFLNLVEPLLGPLNASCGFDIDIPDGYSVFTETKIKRSIFGSISIKVNFEHLKWLSSIGEGGVRGLFRNNIVNNQQLSLLGSAQLLRPIPLSNGLYYICSPTHRTSH